MPTENGLLFHSLKVRIRRAAVKANEQGPMRYISVDDSPNRPDTLEFPLESDLWTVSMNGENESKTTRQRRKNEDKICLKT